MKHALLAALLAACALPSFAGGNVEAGKVLAEKLNCASCHGKDYASPIDPSYPKLAGQHADYLEHALKAYKRGDGANGRANAIMSGQAKTLSTKDIKDISAYLHSLPGPLVLRK
ncbi:cytochrome c [Massilia sp. W12]|uniref:c-type cytochrome n=1 Tax=Massilia sp. W12 TaxID=3126507 RepID=UPI0030D02783